MAQNCWEVKKCGREPGGAKAQELGVCPAATEARTSGFNRGRNAGRCCWAVAGTLCGGQKQGVFAEKLGNCMKCEFYALVMKEEGASVVRTAEILQKLK